MVASVTILVPSIVNTTRVTYETERVFHVDLGGVEYIAIQVRSHIVHRHKPYWKQILFLCNFNYFLTFTKEMF